MDLESFFREHRSVAVAFSGGVDSTYLLCEASRLAERVKAYFVKSRFQPAFELDDACRASASIGAEMQVIRADILSDAAVAANSPDRCYHCKRAIMSKIADAARDDGFTTIVDGTNASDDLADRPGARALAEMHVLSPLRECGITKNSIRERSRSIGLFTWDKPAYACLATRIPTGTPIDASMLERVEGAEDAMTELGFRDFRVRVLQNAARVQLASKDFARAFEMRADIRRAVGAWFDAVLIDLDER